MESRRSVLTIGMSALLAGTAGCVDRIPFLGDDPVEFAATPASVPQSVVDETGYQEHAVEEVVIQETFEAGGRTQDVVVTNWQAEYDKAVDFGGLGLPIDERLQAAVFTALTTPQVRVLGRTFNPVADMSSTDLAEMVQDRYAGLDRLEHVGEETVAIAGQSTEVGEFEGEADLIGADVSVSLTLHIAEAVESGDDLIIGVGGYPTPLQDQERPNVVALMEAIEHDG